MKADGMPSVCCRVVVEVLAASRILWTHTNKRGKKRTSDIFSRWLFSMDLLREEQSSLQSLGFF